MYEFEKKSCCNILKSSDIWPHGTYNPCF